MGNLELDDIAMYISGMSVFLNRWFTTYDEARQARDAEGGILFPYRNHFFITETAATRELGLDPEDPDWEKIGFDWVRPKDAEAWMRLVQKRRASI